MQKNLVVARSQKQYSIKSTPTQAGNSGIDVGFIRTVHRNLMRLYRLYIFSFVRGKCTAEQTRGADAVVRIESGAKRASEQYALFFALDPMLYARNAAEARQQGLSRA